MKECNHKKNVTGKMYCMDKYNMRRVLENKDAIWKEYIMKKWQYEKIVTWTCKFNIKWWNKEKSHPNSSCTKSAQTDNDPSVNGLLNTSAEVTILGLQADMGFKDWCIL